MIVIRYIHWSLSLTKQIFGTVAPSVGSDSVVAGLLLLPSCVGFLDFPCSLIKFPVALLWYLPSVNICSFSEHFCINMVFV